MAFKGTLDNPTEIVIIECKQFKQGKIEEFDEVANSAGYDEPSGLTLNPANLNTNLPTQMSSEWVFNHVFQKMLIGSSDQVKLATGLINQDIVTQYVFSIDKSTGNGYIAKLSNAF